MIKLIAFDMDGTIYSSEKVLGHAYREAVLEFNREYSKELKPPEVGEILKLVGLNPTIIYSTLFPSLTEEELFLLGKKILDELCDRIKKGGGELLGGIEKVFEEFYGKVRLQIVSNGRREYIESILEGFKLKKYFEPLRTVSDNETKSDLLKRVMDAEGVSNTETIMVGDRANDLQAARDNNVKFIGCAYGHSINSEEIKDADYLCGDGGSVSQIINGGINGF